MPRLCPVREAVSSRAGAFMAGSPGLDSHSESRPGSSRQCTACYVSPSVPARHKCESVTGLSWGADASEPHAVISGEPPVQPLVCWPGEQRWGFELLPASDAPDHCTSTADPQRPEVPDRLPRSSWESCDFDLAGMRSTQPWLPGRWGEVGGAAPGESRSCTFGDKATAPPRCEVMSCVYPR